MKNKIKFYIWRTHEEMRVLYENGIVSQNIYDSWTLVWNWCSPRFGNIIGQKHDAFYNKYGKEKYYAKINKTRNAFGFKPI